VSRFPCPCCGYLVFAEPPGSYEVCSICFWEDDALQLEYATTLAGGANGVTLEEAQRTFAAHNVSERHLAAHVRPPGRFDERDPTWRPIDSARDLFPNWNEPHHNGAPEHDETLYYWRPMFWRRGAAT
jgi:hypothetical protein